MKTDFNGPCLALYAALFLDRIVDDFSGGNRFGQRRASKARKT